MSLLTKRSGYLLLEVLVAVTILSVALVTLIGSQSQSVSLAGVARFNTTAALLAQHKLANLALEGNPSESASEGDFADGYPEYGWQLEVNPLDGEQLGAKGVDEYLFQVDLTVFLKNDETSRYTVREIMMAPIEPADRGKS
jgi:general secretion pathway protein I